MLKSGTFELYRDLLVPGGVSNLVPGAGVLALIGAPAHGAGHRPHARNPATSPGRDRRPARRRAQRPRSTRRSTPGGASAASAATSNHLPILMIDGFFDVESRGAFQAYQALRGDGAHLLVVGGHDGAPDGTDGGAGEMATGSTTTCGASDNGVAAPPARAAAGCPTATARTTCDGDFVRCDGERLARARHALALAGARPDAERHRGSLNDGTLGPASRATTSQRYPRRRLAPTQHRPAQRGDHRRRSASTR